MVVNIQTFTMLRGRLPPVWVAPTFGFDTVTVVEGELLPFEIGLVSI